VKSRVQLLGDIIFTLRLHHAVCRQVTQDSARLVECVFWSRTKSFLEYWECRTRQPGRTLLLGPGAVLVLIQITLSSEQMVQTKLKGVIGVENLSPRSFWCGWVCNPRPHAMNIGLMSANAQLPTGGWWAFCEAARLWYLGRSFIGFFWEPLRISQISS